MSGTAGPLPFRIMGSSHLIEVKLPIDKPNVHIAGRGCAFHFKLLYTVLFNPCAHMNLTGFKNNFLLKRSEPALCAVISTVLAVRRSGFWALIKLDSNVVTVVYIENTQALQSDLASIFPWWVPLAKVTFQATWCVHYKYPL